MDHHYRVFSQMKRYVSYTWYPTKPTNLTHLSNTLQPTSCLYLYPKPRINNGRFPSANSRMTSDSEQTKAILQRPAQIGPLSPVEDSAHQRPLHHWHQHFLLLSRSKRPPPPAAIPNPHLQPLAIPSESKSLGMACHS